MGNEHLELPKSPEKWKDYRRESANALGASELMTRWLAERGSDRLHDTHRILAENEFRRLNEADPNSPEGREFGEWARWEAENRRGAADLANTELVEHLWLLKTESSTNPNDAYSFVDGYKWFNLATRLDPSIDKLFSSTEEKAGFQGALEDARNLVRRSSDGLAPTIDGLRLAVEEAVATKYGETPGKCPTFEKSDYRKALDGLYMAVSEWDAFLKTTATPDKGQLQSKVDLIQGNIEWFGKAIKDPSSGAVMDVGLAAISGTAMVKAVGEKVMMQLNARVGTPTFGRMHARICEVPDRGGESNASDLRYREDFQDLRKAWQAEFAAGVDTVKSTLVGAARDLWPDQVKKQLKTESYENIKKGLGTWCDQVKTLSKDIEQDKRDLAMRKMQDAVGTVAFELTRLRAVVEEVLKVEDPLSPTRSLVEKARGRLLEPMDALARHLRKETVRLLQLQVSGVST